MSMHSNVFTTYQTLMARAVSLHINIDIKLNFKGFVTVYDNKFAKFDLWSAFKHNLIKLGVYFTFSNA